MTALQEAILFLAVSPFLSSTQGIKISDGRRGGGWGGGRAKLLPEKEGGRLKASCCREHRRVPYIVIWDCIKQTDSILTAMRIRIRIRNKYRTVIARISVTLSTLHSFISVKKIFDEHVYLTQHAHEP
jgi:hypothetical protein